MLTRRTFVAFVAGAIPVALVTRRADALSARWIAGEAEILRAIAEAVLPSDLGASGAARVAREFLGWMDNYPANAELVHGYGTSALRFSRSSPRPNWAAQLERLESQGFLAKTVEQRRVVIRDELKNERLDRMPAVATAQHVAVALLAYFYGSSMAADMCHEARIGKQTCRTLASSPRKPQPLPVVGGR